MTFLIQWSNFCEVILKYYYYEPRLSFKRYFLIYSIHISKEISLKNSYTKLQISKMSLREGKGDRKSAKKGYILFEWPLNRVIYCVNITRLIGCFFAVFLGRRFPITDVFIVARIVQKSIVNALNI